LDAQPFSGFPSDFFGRLVERAPLTAVSAPNSLRLVRVFIEKLGESIEVVLSLESSSREMYVNTRTISVSPVGVVNSFEPVRDLCFVFLDPLTG